MHLWTLGFSKNSDEVGGRAAPPSPAEDLSVFALFIVVFTRLPSQACQEKSGASSFAVTKYIMKKYASLELEKRKFLLKKALTRLVQKGVVKQVQSLS